MNQLLAAAERLQQAARFAELGWTQGRLCDGGYNVCAAGAIFCAQYGRLPNGYDIWETTYLDAVGHTAVSALTQAIPHDPLANNDVLVTSAITRWNDRKGRTQAEVVSTMRAVAVTLRAQALAAGLPKSAGEPLLPEGSGDSVADPIEEMA